MPKFRRLICFSVAILTILCLVIPVSAAEYNVGVKPGEWIIYGNYDVIDAGDKGSIPAWSKLEVSAVTDQKVLFFASGFYRNGTEFYYHIERTIEANTTLIIASNLTVGDRINPSEEARINRTETRSYLGESRTVNILELYSSIEGVEFSALFVYDKITGLLLEYDVLEIMVTEQASSEYKYKYNIIDTNIFGEKPSPTPEPIEENKLSAVWIAGATIVGVVAVLAVTVVFKKKSKVKKHRYR